ncbi:MAG: HAD family hydrolase [Mesoaciditoga sp.]|uniref:HAD family hydrolase n=1 Tax=Athalassotoga sp. TaxID=2022597 RepID=UPI000CCB69FA|nr:MAG: HAD family hydrolase [Mesoaciditoga sp.]PMP79636.1 MAG: HAD family hydrolase [Mesoaciditoga sp.]HEU23600.1 HAD family hydrolase [Mesoaciditoga lauensis]
MKAFLFDLDGTLLLSDEEIFYDNYFKLVSSEFPEFDPKEFISAINEIIKEMTFEDDLRNNYHKFMEKTGLRFRKDPFEFEKRFTDFYTGKFKLLKSLTLPNHELIEQMRKLDGIKVLATNPLFPEIAIKERMKWAGLREEEFDLITFMENSHYLKPNPKYFLEIASKIKVDPVECTMIGNDPILDGACQKIGMKFVLIGDEDGYKNRIKS